MSPGLCVSASDIQSVPEKRCAGASQNPHSERTESWPARPPGTMPGSPFLE